MALLTRGISSVKALGLISYQLGLGQAEGTLAIQPCWAWFLPLAVDSSAPLSSITVLECSLQSVSSPVTKASFTLFGFSSWLSTVWHCRFHDTLP